MRRKWILISLVLFAMAGVLLAYPLVSTVINSKYHSDIETAYTAAIEDTNTAELEQQRQAAKQYSGTPGFRPAVAFWPDEQEGGLSMDADRVRPA